MRRLWHDLQAHKRAALLFLVYWLATLAVSVATWSGGIPDPVVVLLLTTPLIAGLLVAWWRAPTPEHAARLRDRIGGAALAGVLSALITFLVMKGGLVDEGVGALRGGRFEGGEVLEWGIVVGAVGALLGLAGAVLAILAGRVRHQGRPAPTT